nr:unnamed protein product [Digitaria exilis]
MARPGLPPDLIDDAMAEILLRVPPDEPADLVRASLADKRCRRILTDPNFLRRYREFHRPPPLLGFFHNHPPDDVGSMPRFVATTGASPLPPPEFDGEEWWAMSGRHGRVLIDVGDTGQGLVVWEPLTGDRRRVYLPDSLHGTLCSPTGLGVMFVGTFVGVYTIEVKSGKMKRIGDPGVFYPIVPFMSFCTPGRARAAPHVEDRHLTAAKVKLSSFSWEEEALVVAVIAVTKKLQMVLHNGTDAPVVVAVGHGHSLVVELESVWRK